MSESEGVSVTPVSQLPVAPNAAATTIDYSRKWYVMAAVAMGIFLATIDSSIVNIALPTLESALGAGFAVVQWVVLSYLLTITTLLAIVGRLADMYGKKPLYTLGFIIFTAGSLLCGLSPTAPLLIAARVVQGVGAALILALGLAIVTEAFPPNERGRALGLAGSIVSVGIVTGPTLGGIVIQNLSWHWIFFVNIPIGIIGTLMVMRYLTRTPAPGNQRFDIPGAAVLGTMLFSLLLGLTLGQERGFSSSLSLGLVGLALALLVVFIYIELRHPQPVIDPRLFRSRLFSVNLVTGLLIFIGLGSSILLPFYLQNVLGYSVQQVGLLLAALPVALGIIAPIAGLLADRFGTRPVSAVGLAVITLGYLSMTTLGTQTTAAAFMLRYMLIGVGIGLFQSPNNSAIMGAVPRERLGIASSLLAITRTLGNTVGLSVLSTLFTAAVFRASGGPVVGGATAAAASAQVAGLRLTLIVITCLTGLALSISLWAWRQEAGTT